MRQANCLLEQIIFELNPEASEENFLAVAEKQSNYLNTLPGFVKRELRYSEGKQWVDCLYWSSAEAALYAAETKLPTEKSHKDFYSLIDQDTLQIIYSTTKLYTDNGVRSYTTHLGTFTPQQEEKDNNGTADNSTQPQTSRPAP